MPRPHLWYAAQNGSAEGSQLLRTRRWYSNIWTEPGTYVFLKLHASLSNPSVAVYATTTPSLYTSDRVCSAYLKLASYCRTLLGAHEPSCSQSGKFLLPLYRQGPESIVAADLLRPVAEESERFVPLLLVSYVCPAHLLHSIDSPQYPSQAYAPLLGTGSRQHAHRLASEFCRYHKPSKKQQVKNPMSSRALILAQLAQEIDP